MGSILDGLPNKLLESLDGVDVIGHVDASK